MFFYASRLCCLLFVVLSAGSALAQADTRSGPASPENDGGWGTFGVGVSPDGNELYLSATGNIGRERFVQFGLHGAVDSDLFGRGELVVNHIGLGISDVGRWHRTAVAVGPALVTGVRRVDDEWDRFFTGGVIVSAQAFVTPIKEFGLGLDLFAHVNPVDSGYGLTLSFIFEANK